MVFEMAECAACRSSFRYPREYGRVRYCSADCRVAVEPPRAPWEYKGCVGPKYYSRRRRRAYSTGDRIDPLVIYIASDWTCWLCSGRIDPELVSPDPMSASIDHVQPLGRDGKHVWDNVKPAHAICGLRKDGQYI